MLLEESKQSNNATAATEEAEERERDTRKFNTKKRIGSKKYHPEYIYPIAS